MELSIIIVTYNQEDYIRRTLDSILNQDINCPYEVWIGDDASSDDTPNIILEYMQKYPKIIHGVLRKENLGVIKNYFDLVARCTGKYIMECAGDDYWAPEKVKKELEYMRLHPDASMVCGAVSVVDEKGVQTSVRKGSAGQLTFDKLLLFNPVSALTICFRRVDMEAYIQSVDPSHKKWKMEDYPFLLWLAKNRKIDYIPEVLGSYRVVNGSISNAVDVEKKLRFEKAVYEIRDFFAEQPTDKRRVEKTYYKNVAHIYLLNHETKKYWQYTFKSKDVWAIAKAPFKFLKYCGRINEV